ncbi:unnamed protein product [Mycena citricolor]|uniref:Clathrin/coatomer adaptor adaptin-like N-terminal domain-containing protein n=1 Tax=Mycena citricolor TaxID=2018698 RepID=A0AAD2H2L1_9AGAR|nr:unnamed protein product [Mycena citricolor]
MSAAYHLNAISENASRLGMRLQETFSEHTKDLSLSKGSSLYLEPDDKGRNLKKQLDSSSDREKLDAMKRLVALISKGRNVSEYFAQVVKNVASANLEIRKLVYIYLLRYAEQEPDLALLSINTFQKDLSDSNPLIRAMALRVLSGIKVAMIGSIVVLGIKKCAADMSPYVRKAAALAVPKCYALDASHQPALIEIISSLLRDRSPLSVGSVAVAFEAVCPTRLDMLHQHYRRFCRMLVDVDEWGQINLLNLLLRYARTMLPRPSEGEEMDGDVKLLLNSAEPLFQSRNPAVVLAAARVVYYGGTPSYHPRLIQPLLRLLHTSKEVERVVIAYIIELSRSSPNLFAPFYLQFLLRTDDLRSTKQDKIKLLLLLSNHDAHQAILRELIDCADDPDDVVVADAIHAVGKCAQMVPDCLPQCLTALMTMIKNRRGKSGAVMVLKHLVQKQLSAATSSSFAAVASAPPQSPLTIISQLARRIDDIRHPQARACVIWLTGQYAASAEQGTSHPDGVVEWAPDLLHPDHGCQASRAVSHPPSTGAAVHVRVLAGSIRRELRCAGSSADVEQLDLGAGDTELGGQRRGVERRCRFAERAGQGGLFEGKRGVVETEEPLDSGNTLGSLGAVTHKPMHSDYILPDWLEQGAESSLRDTPEEALPPPPLLSLSSSSAAAPGTGPRSMHAPVVLSPTSGPPSTGLSKPKWTDLDSFYAENEEKSESESEDEDEEEEEEEDEDEEEEEEEEGDEEDTDGDERRI